MTTKQHLGKWLQGRLPFGRRTLNILRYEFRFARQRWQNAWLPWRRAHIGKLRSMRGLLVNVGSGGRGLPDWINFDASPHHADLYCTHDVRRPLPLADSSVKGLIAEHVIEHLDFHDDVPQVFADFHRVLKPGGVARIIVPDVARFMRAYLERSPAQWAQLGFAKGLPSDMCTSMELVNHVFHQGGEHCFGWDYETMEHSLRKAGFSQVVQQHFGRSLLPELAIDQPNHAPYSLYVDAVK